MGDELHSVDFKQFRNDVLKQIGKVNDNSISQDGCISLKLVSIFSNAAKSDGGTADDKFEYKDEDQYNQLLQSGIDMVKRQNENKSEKKYSPRRALENMWTGFVNFSKAVLHKFTN